MPPNGVLGIDIGTRTTVVSYFSASARTIVTHQFPKFGGGATETIPSFYLDKEPSIVNIDLSKPDVSGVADFKIAFWKTDYPSTEVCRQLQGWLERLRIYLASIQGMLDDGTICFTYPSQRHSLRGRFEEMCIAAGFPEGRLLFLDEASAAIYELRPKVIDSRERGLLIDIGAGTTDYALVETLPKIGVQILNVSSKTQAGNDCTKAMANLFTNGRIPELFSGPKKRYGLFQADNLKEDVSDYYRKMENRKRSYTTADTYNGEEVVVQCSDFNAFKKSVEHIWNTIQADIGIQLNAHNVKENDLAYVIVTGGGARHTGLMAYAAEVYGDKLILSKNPQLSVSRGATAFARDQCFSSENVSLPVAHMVAHAVKVTFPKKTRQRGIEILRKDQLVALTESVKGEAKISLSSNFFAAEGKVYLHIGDLSVEVGDLDIKWEAFGESDNHPGTISWSFDPAKGEIRVTLKLQTVRANVFGNLLTKSVSAVVTVAGTSSK